MSASQLKTLGGYGLFDFKKLFDVLCQKTVSNENESDNSNNNSERIVVNNELNNTNNSNTKKEKKKEPLKLSTASTNTKTDEQNISMEIENKPQLVNKTLMRLTKKITKKEIKLLLLTSPIKEASNNNVKKSLLSNGIQNIEVINASETDQKQNFDYNDIQNFDAIFFYTNSPIKNPEKMGNLLARFVEDGGGLVICSCGALAEEFVSKLQGRIVDEPFLPIRKQSFLEKTPLTLGHITDPSHPIMKNVKTFNGGKSSFHVDAKIPEQGSKVIALWSDNTILIAEKQRSRTFGKVIVLNIFPVSGKSNFWNQKTDGARMISNSVEYAATGGVEDDQEY